MVMKKGQNRGDPKLEALRAILDNSEQHVREGALYDYPPPTLAYEIDAEERAEVGE